VPPTAAELIAPNAPDKSVHSYAQLAVQALQWLGEQLTAATLPGDAPAMSAAAAEPAGAIKQQLLRQHAQLLQDANSRQHLSGAVLEQSPVGVQQHGTAAEPHAAAVGKVVAGLRAFGLAVAGALLQQGVQHGSMEGGAQGSLQEAQGSRCSCCGDMKGLGRLCSSWLL
jgi:hypothetical protein